MKEVKLTFNIMLFEGQTSGNTPTQNKKRSRLGGVDENEKPLPTF